MTYFGSSPRVFEDYLSSSLFFCFTDPLFSLYYAFVGVSFRTDDDAAAKA